MSLRITPKITFTREDDLKLIKLRNEHKDNFFAWKIIARTFNCHPHIVKEHYKDLFGSNDPKIRRAFSKYPCPDRRIANHHWAEKESEELERLNSAGKHTVKITKIINRVFKLGLNENAVIGRLRTMGLERSNLKSKRKRPSISQDKALGSKTKRARMSNSGKDQDRAHASSSKTKRMHEAVLEDETAHRSPIFNVKRDRILEDFINNEPPGGYLGLLLWNQPELEELARSMQQATVHCPIPSRREDSPFNPEDFSSAQAAVSNPENAPVHHYNPQSMQQKMEQYALQQKDMLQGMQSTDQPPTGSRASFSRVLQPEAFQIPNPFFEASVQRSSGAYPMTAPMLPSQTPQKVSEETREQNFVNQFFL